MKTLPPKRISQRAVAQAAGVTCPVVSVVLSGQPTSIGVSAETRQRVLDAAQQLGYKPRIAPTNGWGRAKTRTIVWIGDTGTSVMPRNSWFEQSSNMYYQRLLHSVVQTLDGHQFAMVIKPWRDPDMLIDWLAESGAEGVIWRAGTAADQRHLKNIAKQLPVVAINHYFPTEIDRVCVNQTENARLALEHLRERGHRRIAYFGSNQSRRVACYEKFMAEHGLNICLEILSISDDPAIDANTKVHQILDAWTKLSDQRPTALVTGDVFALPLLVEAQRRHINIPADLSVIGIDNYGACEMSKPALTSMDQPLEELGRLAVEMLLWRIANRNRPTQITEVQPSLVVRESVADRR